MGSGQTGPNAGPGVLRWGLRTYAWLVLASILLVAAVTPWAISRAQQPQYEAQALVVAREFELSLDALPRYGEAVFYGGAVAQQVTSSLGLTGDPQDLVSGPLSVIAGQDSVVLTVVGRSSDPTGAARLANEAARVYVTELNRPGPEFGVFVLQSAASPPQQPVDSGPGTVVGLLVGVLAGTALGLAAVGFVLAFRRPVVDPSHFEEVTGAPVLGVVTLSAKPSEADDPRLVPGMRTLVRRLAALPPGTIHLISLRERTRQRSVMVALLNSALDRLGTTSHASDGAKAQRSRRQPDTRARRRVVDVAPALQSKPLHVGATVLLLAEGTPRDDVEDLVVEHLDADVVGVVVVRTRRRSTSRHVRVRPRRPDEDEGAGPPRADEPEPSAGMSDPRGEDTSETTTRGRPVGNAASPP